MGGPEAGASPLTPTHSVRNESRREGSCAPPSRVPPSRHTIPIMSGPHHRARSILTLHTEGPLQDVVGSETQGPKVEGRKTPPYGTRLPGVFAPLLESIGQALPLQ